MQFSTSASICQALFSSSFKFLSLLCFVAVSRGQLAYTTTHIPICQALFFTFFVGIYFVQKRDQNPQKRAQNGPKPSILVPEKKDASCRCPQQEDRCRFRSDPGCPGDLSSASRFVRAAYMKATSVCADSEAASVSQFFHLLGSVHHLRGSVLVDGKPEITQYSSCCNTDKGIYYYTTYENSRITGIDLHAEDLDAHNLICYPLLKEQDILMQNQNQTDERGSCQV